MKGLMLTTPGGSKFWHPCADPKKGMREMAESQAEALTYGKAWNHAQTLIEFGESDGATFTPESVVKAAEPVKAAEGES
jgi:hypothetical protein